MLKEQLDKILFKLLDEFGKSLSDINITPAKHLQVERDGQLISSDKVKLGLKYLSPYQTYQIAMALVGEDKRAMGDLIRSGSCDLAYQLGEVCRFRVNIFSSLGDYSIVLRKLEANVPTFADLKCPKIFLDVAKEKNGLVLVTGATGSGKSTTLAAMLRSMNETKAMHVVTLEDPVEFVHQSIKATFNQRELGKDFDRFPSGLRAALRQAPKVILVGEIRDEETMEIALTAAETGHLVLSTMHTVDAGQTINRIIGMFDKDQEEQVRQRLSGILRWVICQRLLLKEGGGRVAAHEIMGNNLRTRELIEMGEDEVKTFPSVIEAAEALGWQTFELCLVRLYDEGVITEETALLSSTRRSLMLQKIDYIKNTKGEKTTDLEDLSIDESYVKRVHGG